MSSRTYSLWLCFIGIVAKLIMTFSLEVRGLTMHIYKDTALTLIMGECYVIVKKEDGKLLGLD